MPLSSLPSSGPSLPAGAQKVSLKQIDPETASASNMVDVTTLADTQRMYASPPLVEAAGGAGGATSTCSASGVVKGTVPTADPLEFDSEGQPITATGWVCEDAEVVYEVGKHATWSANYSYYPPQSN